MVRYSCFRKGTWKEGKTVRLRELREQRGISQSELARLCGVTRSTICRIEDGSRKPSCVLMVKLAQAIGCKIDDLLVTD